MSYSEINKNRIKQITQILNQELSPSFISVVDESHLHAGHSGAQSGKGHFRLTIVSEQFKNLTLIKQHQLIYQSLGKLMQTDIHALSIEIGKVK